MKKPKRRSEAQDEEEDRLSELPDSVIFLILSFVPMIDVVRTTILSKRWRYLWTTTPFLNFNYNSWVIEKSRKYREFKRSVNNFLFRWNGVRILEFSVHYCFGDLISEIELWVKFAIEKGVEDLYLLDCSAGDFCPVPQCLFSCSSLKLLSIEKCKWRNDDGNVKWNKLRNLKITQGFEVTEHLITQILCGSPLLEVFELSFLDKAQNLNIRSNSLKELSIHKHLPDFDDFNSGYLSLVSASELKIWTPNLETLLIKGIPFGKCGLIDVPSSTHVTIGFTGLFSRVDDRYIPEYVVKGFIQGRFDLMLQAIQHIERVELICGYIQVLGDMVEKKSVYSKVKSLVVRYRCYGYDAFIGPLRLFSQLSRLVLKWYDKEFDMECASFQAANLPESFRLQLRTVDITWCKGDDIFPFVEFLLKYADKLEKMVFRVVAEETAQSSSNSLLVALEELVRMPRASTTCRILTVGSVPNRCSSPWKMNGPSTRRDPRRLKELSICKHLFAPQDLSLTSELTIWTPNLETLKLEGVPFGIYQSIDVSSSTHVSIGFCGSIYHFSGINIGNCLSFHDFLVEKFYRILPKMRYVGSVDFVLNQLKTRPSTLE